jgi:hypothetical protein
VNEKDWPHTMESFVKFLRGCPGEKDVTLARTFPKEITVQPSNDDPSENCRTLQDVLSARASIQLVNGTLEPDYLVNNEAVFVEVHVGLVIMIVLHTYT